MTIMTPILQIDNATKTYHRRGRQSVTALQNATLRINPGEQHFVFGPSGSGKSTLLLCAGGLLEPDRGTVTLNNQNLYAMTPEARSAVRATQIGFVFQQFHLIPYLNVRDNILAPSLAVAGATHQTRADSLMERFGLSHRRDHPPAELSIGERQRVALARALLNNPELILADEPTGSLDEQNGQHVMETLCEFAGKGGAVLIVTHDHRLQPGDSAHHLESGRLTPTRP